MGVQTAIRDIVIGWVFTARRGVMANLPPPAVLAGCVWSSGIAVNQPVAPVFSGDVFRTVPSLRLGTPHSRLAVLGFPLFSANI